MDQDQTEEEEQEVEQREEPLVEEQQANGIGDGDDSKMEQSTSTVGKEEGVTTTRLLYTKLKCCLNLNKWGKKERADARE